MRPRWQVFGLASAPSPAPTVHRFPTARSVRDVEVVLAYRCGAVPGLHRVPFSAHGITRGHQHGTVEWFEIRIELLGSRTVLRARPSHGNTIHTKYRSSVSQGPYR